MSLKHCCSAVMVLVVAFCNQNALVGGQNSTTAAPSGNATTPPPPAQTTPSDNNPTTPTSSTGEEFETKVLVALKISKCNNESKNDLKDAIKKLYDHADYDYKTTEFEMATNNKECISNITMKFGKKLSKTDIIEKFENATKSGDIKGTTQSIETEVSGVTVGKYEATDAMCKEKCCGTGGPITVERTCAPANKCVNYKLKKVEGDCSKVCTKDKLCDGTVMLQVSLLVLLVGGLFNWILKE